MAGIERIQDRVAIVTGASRGIGREVALQLAAAGAHVVVAARDRARLEEVRALLPESAMAVVTDVADPRAVTALIEATVARFGRVELLVNNAGVGLNGIVADLQLADLERVFAVNVFGALACIQACVPHMRRQGFGHIVNVSSILGKRAVPQTAGYAATKFALQALSDGLRIEEKPNGIDVSVVCPASTDTEFRQNEVRSGTLLVADRPRLSLSSPADVAREVVRAIRKRKREVVLTATAKLMTALDAVAPRLVDAALGRAFRR